MDMIGEIQVTKLLN